MANPTRVDGWTLGNKLGAGKSADVYLAARGADQAAIKLFKPELVDRFGRAIQLGRIQREISLVGLSNDNLVKIIGGGECSDTGHLYIAMEYIDAPNLATVLTDVPRGQIWPIIGQIASAARFLEEHQLAHRDIKPENIAISRDFKKATLLDLGVIRPYGVADLTDADQRVFIGTLRYSSPEFLLREEKDVPDGWRALAFYQLGAVLHDLIMKARIYEDFSDPYARLVQAVESIMPAIVAKDVPADLVFLTRNCLVKDPSLRLSFVRWDQFAPPADKPLTVASLKERIRARQQHRTGSDASPQPSEDHIRTILRTVSELQSQLQTLIRRICIGSDFFPPMKLSTVANNGSLPESSCLTLSFPQSLAHSLHEGLHIWLTLTLLDPSARAVRLSVAGALYSGAIASVNQLPREIDAFAGVFDEDVIVPVLEELLLSFLDQAQQDAAQRHDHAATDLIWLTPSKQSALGD